MLDYINYITGNIEIINKTGKIIYFKGVRPYVLNQILNKLYNTTRVANNIIYYRTYTSFSIHGFFLPDFYFTLQLLLKAYDNNEINLMPRRTIADLLGLIEANTMLKPLDPVPKSDYSLLNGLNYKPLEHQMDFLDNIHYRRLQYQLKGSVLNAAPGSGKTLTSMFASHLLKADKVIVISPLNAIHRVWESTITSAYKKPVKYWLSTTDKNFEDKDNKYYVTHYDYLSKFVNLCGSIKSKYTMIIVDECHNFNEVKTSRTQLLFEIAKIMNPEYVLLMSGTPLKAVAMETLPSFKLIDPLFDDMAEVAFKNIYKGSNTKAVDILNNRLGIISTIVEKKELKLKDPITTVIDIKHKDANEYTLTSVKTKMLTFTEERTKYYNGIMDKCKETFKRCLSQHEQLLHTSEDKAEFSEYKRNLSAIFTAGNNLRSVNTEIILCNKYERSKLIPSLEREDKLAFKEVTAIVKYVKLKVLGECLGRVLTRLRQDCFCLIAENIDYESIIEATYKKTVIFTNYIAVAESAMNAVSEKNYKPVGVFGNFTKDLNVHVKKFADDPKINPLVATYPSLSTAVPLIMADTLILIDIPYRDYLLQQAIARVWRLGNEGNTYIFRFKLDTGSEPNIVSRSVDILTWAREQVEAMTGVQSPLTLDATDVDQLDNIGLENFIYTYNDKQQKLSYMDW
jgi:SNF2 family DNA or RNA helicase